MYYVYYRAIQYSRQKNRSISYHTWLVVYLHHISLHRIVSYRIDDDDNNKDDDDDDDDDDDE